MPPPAPGRPLARCLAPAARRAFSAAAAAHPANRTQVYLSRSRDPLLNLAVEHHLLLATPPDAAVLLLYANTPCVVVGRNQNPWREADLARLARDGAVGLVRRRSGGGAVFHGDGNVNFAVIGPPAAFDRARHALMVVRALAALGRPARLSPRHDIVVDDAAAAAVFKVSGSAYKLTRRRALHHGTCLLRSPDLPRIAALLRSPAEPFVRARGVDSVPSAVRNLDLDADDFAAAVEEQFARMYGRPHVRRDFAAAALAVDGVRRAYDELRARDWVYGQTPRFVFATHPSADDPRPRPRLPFDLSIRFEARHGVVERFAVDGADAPALVGGAVHDVRDWTERLARAGVAGADAGAAGAWMNAVLGTDFTRAGLPEDPSQG